MIKPRYSLRALISLLTLTALALGIGLPLNKEYQRRVQVAKIRHIIDEALTEARALAEDNPESAKQNILVLRESVLRAPPLNDRERRKSTLVLDRDIAVCEARIAVLESQRHLYSCYSASQVDDLDQAAAAKGAVERVLSTKY